MKTKKTQRSTTYTVNALSVETGIDRRTIRKKLVEGKLDPKRKHTLASVLPLLKPAATEASPIKEKVLFEQWRKLRIRNDREEGEMVPNATVTQLLLDVTARQRDILRRRLENELPTAMAGVDPGSGRIIAKRVVDEVCREMQQFYESWTTPK